MLFNLRYPPQIAIVAAAMEREGFRVAVAA
jgi:hypothetical protein